MMRGEVDASEAIQAHPTPSEITEVLADAMGLAPDDPSLRKAVRDVTALFAGSRPGHPLWRHLKTGDNYREVRRVKLKKATDTPLVEGDTLVLYADVEGADIHARAADEFEDGRFERLAP